MRGYGWTPHFVEGHEPALMHEAMAATLDTAVEQIRTIQRDARVHGKHGASALADDRAANRPRAGPGRRSSTASRSKARSARTRCRSQPRPRHPAHLKLLEDWLRSYRPEELFDEHGRLKPELAELAPRGRRGAWARIPTPTAALLLRDLRMPDFRDYAVDVPTPARSGVGDTRVLGPFLRDVVKLNQEQRNFRVFGPDETTSNGLGALFEVDRRGNGTRRPDPTTNSSRRAAA